MRWWGREGLSLECGREVRAQLCGLQKKLGDVGGLGMTGLIHGASVVLPVAENPGRE